MMGIAIESTLKKRVLVLILGKISQKLLTKKIRFNTGQKVSLKLSSTTLSIMTFSIMVLFATLSMTFSTMYFVSLCSVSQLLKHYAQCHNYLNIMLSDLMLNVVRLNVVMLSVVAPKLHIEHRND